MAGGPPSTGEVATLTSASARTGVCIAFHSSTSAISDRVSSGRNGMSAAHVLAESNAAPRVTNGDILANVCQDYVKSVFRLTVGFISSTVITLTPMLPRGAASCLALRLERVRED